jgi:hypothetical protein
MVCIKPTGDPNARDENADYLGPEPSPGIYRGCIDKMWLTTFKSGERQGKPKLTVLFKITEGPCKGKDLWWHLLGYDHPISDGIMNSRFLPALTDGSPEKIEAARKAFWSKDLEIGGKERMGQVVSTFAGRKVGPSMKVAAQLKMGFYERNFTISARSSPWVPYTVDTLSMIACAVSGSAPLGLASHLKSRSIGNPTTRATCSPFPRWLPLTPGGKSTGLSRGR